MTSKTERIDFLATDARLAEIIQAKLGGRERRTSSARLRLFSDVSRIRSSDVIPLLVVSSIRSFRPEFFRCLRSIRKAVYCLFVHDDEPFSAEIDRLDALGLRSIRRWHVHQSSAEGSEEELIERCINTWIARDAESRIVDARVYTDTREILLVSRELEKLLVPIDDIPQIASRSDTELLDFEIDEDGSFIYWPKLDVHLGWEQFEQIADPRKALAAKQAGDDFNRRYGAAIRAHREARGLRQQDIAGLDPRQIRRIEHGQCRATLSALKKLAGAHALSLAEYMSALSRKRGI